MVGVDGAILPLATSQDHKARDDGDKGPNTGGMGAYSPAPVVTDAIAKRVMDEVMRPVVEGLRQDGVRYFGFLYAGLMIAPDGTPERARVQLPLRRPGDPADSLPPEVGPRGPARRRARRPARQDRAPSGTRARPWAS